MANLGRLLSQHPAEAAKGLLGCKLIRMFPEGELCVCRIVEAEAYHESEPGCHAFRGRTMRNAPMFLKAGCAYIYFIYGMYYCLNVSCGQEGEGAAVLIRAAESLAPSNLRLDGPGRLCRSLRITTELNGCDLLAKESPLRLVSASLKVGESVASSKRIGLSVEEKLLWRYFIEGNRAVSKARRTSKNS